VAQLGLAVPAVLAGLFQRDLRTTSAELTWISDMFMVPVTLLELSSSVLGDLFGRKRLLVAGAGVLGLGELVSMLTPGTGSSSGTRVLVLCIGQAAAGIGGAALFATSLAMLAARATSPAERTRSVAIWAAALSTGGFISPLVGGLTGSQPFFGGGADSGWRWTFLVVGAMGLVSAGVTAIFSGDSRSPEGRSLDLPGQLSVALALLALLVGVVQGPTSGWASPVVLAPLALGVTLTAGFVALERRAKAPLVPFELFRDRAYAMASIVTVVGMFAFLGTGYATSVRLAAVEGFSPLRTAVAFVLLSGMTLVLTKASASLLARHGPTWVLASGFGLMGAGDTWMARLSTGRLSLVEVAAPLAIVGVGFALAVSSVTEAALAGVPARLAGLASGVNNLLRNLGFTLGPPVVGAVALTLAANELHRDLLHRPSLAKALSSFEGLVAKAPVGARPALRAAIDAVRSGPLGANAIPARATIGSRTVPFNPLKDVAYHALSHGFSVGYAICAAAAFLGAAAVVVAMRPRRPKRRATIAGESLERIGGKRR
jgi:MFS family permease